MAKYLFDPNSKEPYKLSRSKIDFFLECPRCFYLDVKLGVKRPDIPGFSLNNAVDELLKKEFDLLRKNGEAHELMKKYNIDAVPFKHPELDTWRYNFTGKQFLHPATNLLIFGAIDDIWVNPAGELLIVDYKATSTNKEISLDDEFKQGYKHQMEIYQWIFRQSGFKVNKTGYFVFANALKTPAKFDGKLEFDLTIIAHVGDDSWVEPVILKIHQLLINDKIPSSSEGCKYCLYRNSANEAVF